MEPSETEIYETIREINQVLKNPAIEHVDNMAVKEGYTEVHTILVENRRNYDGIDKLKYQQARAIAVLGCDFLTGQCTKEVLLGVPLKT